MRSLIKRTLPLALVAAVGLTGFAAAPASAADGNCNYYVYVGPQGVGVDDPIEGMTGVIYVCLTGPVTASVGAGVWIHQEADGLHVDPVICNAGRCSKVLR